MDACHEAFNANLSELLGVRVLVAASDFTLYVVFYSNFQKWTAKADW
jgi:hypothetical protein